MLQDILNYYSIKTRRQVKHYKYEKVRWPNHRAPRAAPRQAKVVVGGGDLRFAQVEAPLSVIHYCF